MRRMALAVVLGLCAVPAALAAQEQNGPGPFRGGATLLYGSPRGEFADYVDRSFGLSANVAWMPAGFLGVRVDGGFMNYGHESKTVPLSSTVGGRVTVELTTDNNIGWIGIGPQLLAPSGAVRPYAHATAGLAYFATTSSVRGDDSSEAFASDTNHDDTVFQWGAGGGLLIPVSSGRTPVAIDLSARYHGNARATYVTEGGIEDNPDGTITVNAVESDADVLTFHVGVSIGFGRRGS